MSSLRRAMTALFVLGGLPAAAEPAPEISARQAPKFRDEVRLAEHQGQVVVMNFWATWCPPALEEMDALRDVYTLFNDRNGDGLVDVRDRDSEGRLTLEIISLSVDSRRDRGKIKPLLRSKSLPFIIAWDEDEQTSQRYNQQFNLNGVIPQVFIIDPQGDIVSRIEGYHGGEECRIIDTIAGLLEQSNLTLPDCGSH